jgi:Sigma-70, region 4
MINFSPKTVTKELLQALPTRSRDVVLGRFGLGKGSDKMTLEAIGARYGITRERVRQIENQSVSLIQKSEQYQNQRLAFDELSDAIRALGSVMSETDILDAVATNTTDRRHLLFMLVVGEPFAQEKETGQFVRRWSVDPTLSSRIHQALRGLHDELDPNNLIPEQEFVELFTAKLEEVGHGGSKDEELLRRWLGLSKRVARNPLGEWGLAHSPHVRVKSMRDYAYLTLKRHGAPLHFSEVASAITKLFKKKAHPATCHNELIKDERFVLVGRGLYALGEWGYERGVVRDVIIKVMEKAAVPLSRQEIIDKVKRERYVRDNTIIVNLQDRMFKRTKDGKYEIVK